MKNLKWMKKKIALFVCSFMTVSMLVSCGSQPDKVDIAGKADLAGKKIGVQNGTTGEDYAKKEVKDADVKSYKSGLDAALDLKNGSIDAIVLDILPAKAIVENNPDLMVLDKPLTTEEYAIAVRKGDTELLNAINASIARMKEDGTYEAIREAFIPESGEIVIPTTPRAEGSETIKMGTNASFPPFEYTDGTDIVGFDVEMANEIAKDLGKKLQIENMPFESLLAALDAGVVDFLVAGMTVTKDRLKSVDFSDTYYDAAQVIIVRK